VFTGFYKAAGMKIGTAETIKSSADMLQLLKDGAGWQRFLSTAF